MKNKISQKKSLVFRIMAICIIFLTSMFDISACTWFEDDATSGNSNYDANGNLRITSVNVTLNKPENGSVSEDTGSFAWDFEYYINSTDKNLVDQYYDQLNYDLLYNELNLITDENDVSSEDGEDVTVKKAIVTAKELIRNNTYSQNIYLLSDGSYLYGNKQIYFHFPTYTISISGITYQVRVDVNYSRLAVVMGKNGLFEVADGYSAQDVFTVSYRTGTDGDWKTDYQMAKVVEFKADSDSTASTATGTADPYANVGSKFKIYFNPMLNKGSTNRYIRVQSIPSVKFSSNTNLNRGNSVYTSPVTFNVYKQTFKITCNNSSEYTYEGLTYDSTKYYFSTKEERSDTTFSNNLTADVTGYGSTTDTTKFKAYSTLTGYFVEGRVISVDRYIDTSSDYGFQAWTINGKADNSTTITCATPNISGYPSDVSADACLNYYSMNSMGIKAVDYKDYISETSTTLATESAFNIFGSISESKPYYEILSKGNVVIADTSATTSTETSTSPNYYKGSLYAVVCTNSASNVYYCNVAKVRNFILSGTLYDGENFFVINTAALLDNVDIYIWQGSILLAKFDGTTLYQINNTADAHCALMGLANFDEWKNSLSISDSQFSIGNLAYDCSISFGKKSSDTNGGDANNYSFYSATMTTSTNDDIYKLCVENSDKSYSDRIGNTIIGTKYTADNKIEVNLYYENGSDIVWAGNAQTNTAYNGVQYQVISTTQEETDVFGYTTSKVIISLLLPTNCTLTGYNVESVNSICKVLYTNGTTKTIVCEVGYDEKNRKATFEYYYVTESQDPEGNDFVSNNVSGGGTLNCLMYNSKFYQYTHRDTHTKDNDTYYDYYYAYDETKQEDGKNILYRYVICRSEKEGSDDNATTYTHTTYKQITDSISSSPNYDYDSVEEKITVSGTISYDGNNYNYDKQYGDSQVEVIATGYKTDLEFSYTQGESTGSYNMYVYYNIVDYTYKNGGSNITEYYYTAPLGLRTTTANVDSANVPTSKTQITWFHDELNEYLSKVSGENLYLSYMVYDSSMTSSDNQKIYNMEYTYSNGYHSLYKCSISTDSNKNVLAISKTDSWSYTRGTFNGEATSYTYAQCEELPCIMLGADILDGKAGLAGSKFLDATDGGKNIIANHYYYIKPVGDGDATSGYTSTDLLISQYISTDSSTISQQQSVLFCKNDTVFTGDSKSYISEYKFRFQAQVSPESESSSIASFDIFDENNEINYSSITLYKNGQKVDGTTYRLSTIPSSTGSRSLMVDGISYTISGGNADILSSGISQNISAIGTKDDKTYIKERKYLPFTKTASDATGTDIELTPIYHVYTFSTENGKLFDNYLYFDGSNYYVTTGKTISATNTTTGKTTSYPEIKKLVDGKTEDGFKLMNGSNFANECEYDGATYTNIIIREFYETQKSTTDAVGYSNSLDLSFHTKYVPYLINSNDDTKYFRLISNLSINQNGSVTEYYGLINPKNANGSVTNNYIDAYGDKYVIENNKFVTYTGDIPTEESEYKAIYVLLNLKQVTVTGVASSNVIVRKAITKTTGENVHLLGKVVLLGNAEFDIYPSFSYYMKNSDKGILNASNGTVNYYTVDYTTINNVIQGFPGVKILSGAPYVNPIMYFEVKHKADEKAVIDIGLELTKGYYVEVLSNAIDSTENNLIYDFSTVTFKDTITNLTSNDYINRMYYVLDRDTQKSIIAYTKTTIDGNDVYTPYISGTPLTIQNIGMNEGDEYIYSILQINKETKYFDKLYVKTGEDTYEELTQDNLIIWQSSNTALDDIPTFDAHNYYVSDNGLIILTSDGQDNEICSKLEDLFISGIGSAYDSYNYDDVLIGGLTSAYRVDADAINNKNGSGTFWKENAINISNNYDFGDPYFLTGKEGVVLVANPIVNLHDEDGTDIMYSFKRWAVYGRYNSEILYYNQELSSSLADIESAVLSFTSDTAGYYIFMPIYERIYSLNIGTAIEDGALNSGGSVSVNYDKTTGTSINLEASHYGDDALDIFLVEMLKTQKNNVTQYYYNDLEITPFLYFTGEFGTYTQGENTYYYPIFEERTDIIQLKESDYRTYYYKVVCTEADTANNKFTFKFSNVSVSNTLKAPTTNDDGTTVYYPCIVEAKSRMNGYSTFEFTYAKSDSTQETIKCSTQYLSSYFSFCTSEVDASTGVRTFYYPYNDPTKKIQAPTVNDLMCYGYSVNYYFDGVGTSSYKSKVVAYNDDDSLFYAIDIDKFVEFYNGGSVSLTIDADSKKIKDAETNKIIGTIPDDAPSNYLMDFATKAVLNKFYNSGESFAELVNKKFNSIERDNGSDTLLFKSSLGDLPEDFYSNSQFYHSKLAYLSSGELYTHKETVTEIDDAGNELTEEIDVINTTQQFKSSYFTRDTRMIISAKADSGYRLKDWYFVEYNEKTQSWVKGKALSESLTASYDDIIREVYYNPFVGTNGTWYWVTNYKEPIKTITDGTTNQETQYYIYYTDSEKTTQATVPSNMLDDVRGYYVETGNNVWTPVYRRNSTSGEWYFDQSFTLPYSGDTSKIQQKSHYECIRSWNDSSSRRYLLGDVEVYKFNGEYYRTMDLGNMLIKDNKIFIYNLHNNLRIVAEFVEVYQSYVLTEEPSEENIQTVALYYTGIRSDKKGNNLTDLQDTQTGNMEKLDFAYKQGETNKTGLSSENYKGYENYSTLINSDLGLYKATDRQGGNSTVVDLVNMYFDVNTTIYIVVKVNYAQELTIHSLGMNSQYQLTAVTYPTDNYINSNKSAENSDEHYFYIFKVTFNRDLTYYYSNNGNNDYTYMTAEDKDTLESVVDSKTLTTTVGDGNYNPEYIIHVNRKKAIVSDVLNGNYTKYYSNLFDFYFDFDENPVELEFIGNKVRIVGSSLTALENYISEKDIDTSNTSLKTLLEEYQDNIKDLFTKLRDDYGINLCFAYVKQKVSSEEGTATLSSETTDNRKKLQTVSEIFSVVTRKFLTTDKNDLKNIKNVYTGPISTGSINYINLATIPIYTYTTKIKILSNIDNETVEFDEDMEQVFDELGVKLIQQLYTRGGYNGYTYIGVGSKETSDQSITINGATTVYNYTFKNSKDTNDDTVDSIGMFDQEYALAQDTIMVLEGIGELGNDNQVLNNYTYLKSDDGGKTWYINVPVSQNGDIKEYVQYVFTGWYEQKEVTNADGVSSWSDLQLVSNDLTQPFASVAYADTNIVALFERAVKISFEDSTVQDDDTIYAKNTFTANFNSQTDSLGNLVERDNSAENKTIVSGTFTISTKLSVDITPTGGYRLYNQWSFGGTDKILTNVKVGSNTGSQVFSFGQYNENTGTLESKNFDELNLVTTTQFTFMVGQLLQNTSQGTSPITEVDSYGYTSETFNILQANNRTNNSLVINLHMKPVQLTYIYINGYMVSNGSNYANAGYEFALIYVPNNGNPELLVETQFNNSIIGKVKNTVSGKDSAQRDIKIELDGNNLAIYGYFDCDAYNGNLYVSSIKQSDTASLKGWYINTHPDATSEITDFPNYSSLSHTISGTTYTSLMKIYYEYSADTIYGSDSSNFPEQPLNASSEDISEESRINLTNKYNDTFFNLSTNNKVYMLKAEIKEKSIVQISYMTTDSISTNMSFNEANLFNKGDKDSEGTITNSLGAISWTGAYYPDINSESYLVNDRTSFFGIPTIRYAFSSATNMTISNNAEFYDDASGNSYQFVGWFKEDSDHKLTLVSETVTYSSTAGGHFVAVFAKTVKISYAYTDTVNVENSKNQNGTINIISNYTLPKQTNSNLIDTSIKVYGTRTVGDSTEMYAVIGGTIQIIATADQNYLVSDIVIKLSDTETSILEYSDKDKSEITKDYTVDIVEPFEIIAQIRRGYSVNIVELYYDSVAMSNIGIEIPMNHIKLQKEVDGTYPNDNLLNSSTGYHCFTANTKIKLTFTNPTTGTSATNLGLIGFYVNGEFVQATATNESNNQFYIILDVSEDSTIEVRTTQFVKAIVNAYIYNGSSIGVYGNGTQRINSISYAIFSTNQPINVTIPESITSVSFTVLNGTILSLEANDEIVNLTFINWSKALDGESVDTILSSDNQYNYAIEYDYDDYRNNSQKTIYVKANFQSSFDVTVEKVIGQLHPDDSNKGYNKDDLNTSADKLTDELWAILDVQFNYTDAGIIGESANTTTILGNSKKKTFDVLANDHVQIATAINKSHETKYTAVFTITYNDGTETIAQDADGKYFVNITAVSTITVTFYAKRNITLVRKVDSQESTNNLELSFGITGSGETRSIPEYKSKITYDNIQYQDKNLYINADQKDGYTFAGFIINGNAVGKGHEIDGTYTIYVDFPSDGHENGTIYTSEDDKTTYYIDSADLTITGLWYSSNNLDIKVTIDGVDILSSSSDAVKALQDKLYLSIYGNLISDNTDTNLFNTTLQLTTITSENRQSLYYLHGRTLALIASNYAGYQFVGFFVNGNKLDFNRLTDYTYADTLLSLLKLENENTTYIIEARYLTAWQVTTQVSYAESNKLDSMNTKVEEASTATKFYQVYKDGETYKIITSANYDIFSGTANNKYYKNYYFYPQHSQYIAVKIDVPGFMDDLGLYTTATPIGYYINGYYAEVEATCNFGDGNSYAIIDLTKVDAFESSDGEFEKTNDLYGFANMVIERKFVENVEYVVRIGVNDITDITKLENSNFNNIKISLTYTNPYTNATTQLTLNNSSSGSTSTNISTYWNTANNCLYYRLFLPIGTKIETSINGSTISIAGKDYALNGWYVYSDYNVASSTSVINYTNKVEFILTDNTDIIAQYWEGKPEEKTTDTQFSYQFNGEAFIDANGNNEGFYSPATQGGSTDSSTIAEGITRLLLGIPYNVGAFSETIDGLGSDSITISSEDGIIFTITRRDGSSHNFMFMGWYQEIKDNKNPSKYLFVTDDLGLLYDNDSMPAQMKYASNMTAIFTQVVTLNLGFNNDESGTNTEVKNTLLYSYLANTYSQIAPIWFANYEKAGELLNAQLDKDGALIINLLYDSYIRLNYLVSNGYHSNDINANDSSFSTSFDLQLKEDSTTSALKYFIEKAETETSDKYIHTTDYKYKFSSNDQEILGVQTQIKTCDAHASASTSATTLVLAGEAENVSLTSTLACSIGDSNNKTTRRKSRSSSNFGVSLTGFDISNDETYTNKANGIGSKIITPNMEKLTLTITITFQNGIKRILELYGEDKILIEKEQLADGSYIILRKETDIDLSDSLSGILSQLYSYEKDEDGNYKIGTNEQGIIATDEAGNYQYLTLPANTSVSIEIKNLDSLKNLDYVRVYYIENVENFKNGTLESAYTELTTSPTSSDLAETSASATFIIPTYANANINNHYLLFIINFKNIYSLELVSNDITKGSATLEYQANDDSPEASDYNFNIDALANFAFDDLSISIRQSTSSTTFEDAQSLKDILLRLLGYDLSYNDANNDNFINLKDLLDLLKDKANESESGKLEYNLYTFKVLEDNKYELTRAKGDDTNYYTIQFSTTLSSADNLNRQYITAVSSKFNLLTDMKIETKYLHVANVSTNYAVEEFDPNPGEGESYISKKPGTSTYTLFIYDYEFGHEMATTDGARYIFINRLETFYDNLTELQNILDSNGFTQVGYYYSGNILKNNKDDSYTQRVTPISGRDCISDNITIENIYVGEITSYLGYHIDYFNNEIGYEGDNPNLLNTPQDNLKFLNNKEKINFDLDEKTGNTTTRATLTTSLNIASDITIEDSNKFFSFYCWKVIYDGKYVAIKNSDNSYKDFIFESSAISLGSTLYRTIIEQIKASASYDEGYWYKWDGTDIDMTKLHIEAWLKEEVVELDFNYEELGEEFEIQILDKNNSNTKIYGPWKTSDIGINETTWLHGTSLNEYYNFLIRQVEDDENGNMLRLVYSKYLATDANLADKVGIKVIAQSYTDRSSKSLARSLETIAIREILNDGKYSNSTYLKLNGFRDMLGNVHATSYNSLNKAIETTTTTSNHTTSYWLDTTPLYLIELGVALYIESMQGDDKIELLITDTDLGTSSNTVSIATDFYLSQGANYAGISILVEEGHLIKVSVVNDGNLDWSNSPVDGDSHYRGLAVSQTLTMSDIYKAFTGSDYGSLTQINKANKTAWNTVLGITGEDGQNDFYKTLNQYSNFYITQNATQYLFTATKNMSFISDYIGIFTTQKQYISAVLGADNSVKYEKETEATTNKNHYTGENFIFVIASKNTQITLKRNDTGKKYTEIEDETIIETPNGRINKDLITKAPASSESGIETMAVDESSGDLTFHQNDYMNFYSQNTHTYIGVVSDRYVSGSITVLYKYVTYNQQLLKDLGKALTEEVKDYLGNDRFIYNWINPKYTTTTTITDAPAEDDTPTDTGEDETIAEEPSTDESSGASTSISNIPGVYIVANDKDIASFSSSDLTTSINIKKGKVNVYLLAEVKPNYTFTGFKLISQSEKIVISNNCQNKISSGSIYTASTLAEIATSGTDYAIQKIGEKYYYYAQINNIEGNVSVVALYEPRIYIINLVHKAFDEADAIENAQNNGGQFKPELELDEDSTYGKITAPSLVVSGGDIVELKISTKGFAEYKGMASNDDIKAIYSEKGSINNSDGSTPAVGNTGGNADFWNYLMSTDPDYWADLITDGKDSLWKQADETTAEEGDIETIADEDIKGETSTPEMEKPTEVLHYSNGISEDISDGITVNRLHNNVLFTSEYSHLGEDKSFEQNSNTVSYLYLILDGSLEDDITLYAYFASLYYTMDITIGEMQSALGEETELQNGAYVAYSKEYQEYIASTEGKWINPSADSNLKDGEQYGISDSDPYVYTFVDCNGKNLSYPVRVTQSMLSPAGVALNEESENLTLTNGQEIYVLPSSYSNNTIQRSFTITSTEEGVAETKLPTCSTEYATSELKNLYNYLKIENSHYKFLDGLFSITVADDTINSQDLDLDKETIELKNTAGETMVIIPNIEISGLAQLDVRINLTRSSIVLRLRVFADENSGFPSVGIDRPKSDTQETVSMSLARVLEVEYNEEDGTFEEVFFADALIYDEEAKTLVVDKEKYPNGLHLDAEIIFQIFAKKVTTELNFGTDGATIAGENSEELRINLTNSDDYATLEKLATNYHNNRTGDHLHENCNTCAQSPYCTLDHNSMIDEYSLYIIKNAYTYISALNDAVERNMLSEYYAETFIAELLAFNPACDSDESGNCTLPVTGNVLDYMQIFNKDLLITILDNCGYKDLATKLETSDDLTFRQLDVYSNFKTGEIDNQYYGNVLLYGDMAVTVTKLTEHSAPHSIDYFFGNGIWEEHVAYTYINSAISNWTLKGKQAEGTGGTYIYDEVTNNTFDRISKSISKLEPTNQQKWANFWAGILSNTAKYRNTFTRYIFSSIIPGQEEFTKDLTNTGNDAIAFTCVVSINLNTNTVNYNEGLLEENIMNNDYGRIVTGELEKVHVEGWKFVLDVVLDIVFIGGIIAAIALSPVLLPAQVIAGAFIIATFTTYLCVEYGIAVFNGLTIDEYNQMFNSTS